MKWTTEEQFKVKPQAKVQGLIPLTTNSSC
jgi:hypothetical protein